MRAPSVDRLDQGPFGIEQDEGWRTALAPGATEAPAANPGLGLIGYAWEESGPSLAAREGRETLERHVEKLVALPFVDVLYIRCDWRDVQRRPGRLDLSPVWGLARMRARLGYRVRPAWVWQRKRSGGSEIIVAAANDGVAGVPGALRLEASSPDGTILASGSLDPGHPHAGRLRQAALPLPAGRWPAITLRAGIEMKGGVRRPVRWACREVAADGSLVVPLAASEDPTFRKGV